MDVHHANLAPPSAIDERTSAAGLRAVATFEGVKGVAVLTLGIVLLFVHAHAEDFTSSLLFHLHIDPDRRMARAVLNAAQKVNDARLLSIMGAVVSYTTVRFVEAWGLWNRRVWAEWFALLSGCLYIPWECLRLAERTDWERASVLVLNIGIVLYMLYVRIASCRPPKQCANERVIAETTSQAEK